MQNKWVWKMAKFKWAESDLKACFNVTQWLIGLNKPVFYKLVEFISAQTCSLC